MCKETPIKQADFSAKTVQAREQWNNILKVLKEKKNPLVISTALVAWIP